MRKLIMGSLLITLAVLGQGCGSNGGGFSADQAPDNQTTTTPTTPSRDTDLERGTDFASGATAAIQLDSLAMLSSYAITHPVNAPTDLRVSIKLTETDTASNMYSGKVLVSYHDNGQYYTGRFESKNQLNSLANNQFLYNGYNQSYYNNWMTQTNPNSPSFGKPVFHGFFQDEYGAIMLVIDDSIDQGDGSGAAEVSGSIWFKNFSNSQAQANVNDIPCWFITTGPYDCRTLLVPGGRYGDGNIDGASAFYPTESKFYPSTKNNAYAIQEPARGWRKLGSFTSLNKARAFGN